MAPHSSTLAWKIPWAEKPGGLQSMGSHRVGHDCSDLAAAAALYTVFLKKFCHQIRYIKQTALEEENGDVLILW